MRHFQSVIGVAVVTAGLAVSQPVTAQNYRWYEVRDQQVRIDLYVFWSKTCSNCTEAWKFIHGMRKRHPWINLHAYEITTYPANRQLYHQMAQSLHYHNAGPVPAFFYCKKMMIGFQTPQSSGKTLESALVRWQATLQTRYEQRQQTPPPLALLPLADLGGLTTLSVLLFQGLEEQPSPPEAAWSPPTLPTPPTAEDDLFDLDAAFPAEEEQFVVPVWGTVTADEVSLPAFTLVLAGLDAFNPCAFFVLMILLSIMLRTQSRGRMLLVGGVFVFFSGLMYFLFMAAWLNLFFLVGYLRVITLAAGIIAVTAALINVKDYFWFKQGASLSIPESAKPGLFKRMNALVSSVSLGTVLVGAASLAAIANLYELLCTAGFPMIYTRVLTLRELPTETYYFWLATYNLIYIIPLACIVLGFSLTLSSHRLNEYEGRVMKLFSGMMMLTLGGVLLIEPEWLNTLRGAVSALAVAVGLATTIALVDRLRRRHWKTRSEQGQGKLEV